jgi:hypothetical protein
MHEGAALFGALKRRGFSYRDSLGVVDSLMGIHPRNIERCRKNQRVQPLDDDSEDNLARWAIVKYKLAAKASAVGINLPADLLHP